MMGAATSELQRTSTGWAHSGRPPTRKGRISQQRRMLMQSWVFARKGKRETPEIKARFVGRTFAERDGRDGEVFAGTPELTGCSTVADHPLHNSAWLRDTCSSGFRIGDSSN